MLTVVVGAYTLLSDEAPVLNTPDAVPILDPSSLIDVQRSQNLPVLFGLSPNIQGELIAANTSHGLFSPNSTGAFEVWPGTNEIQADIVGDKQGNNKVFFSPQKTSAIYGGSKLQPSALALLACIRV